ncbi:hypothetical protein HDV05_003721 [Chytridiales sp. JEL 0842]|nr:hypothetical protein HDV05_003721 [Chytridiales sp. JEL 0842]
MTVKDRPSLPPVHGPVKSNKRPPLHLKSSKLNATNKALSLSKNSISALHDELETLSAVKSRWAAAGKASQSNTSSMDSLAAPKKGSDRQNGGGGRNSKATTTDFDGHGGSVSTLKTSVRNSLAESLASSYYDEGAEQSNKSGWLYTDENTWNNKTRLNTAAAPQESMGSLVSRGSSARRVVEGSKDNLTSSWGTLADANIGLVEGLDLLPPSQRETESRESHENFEHEMEHDNDDKDALSRNIHQNELSYNEARQTPKSRPVQEAEVSQPVVPESYGGYQTAPKTPNYFATDFTDEPLSDQSQEFEQPSKTDHWKEEVPPPPLPVVEHDTSPPEERPPTSASLDTVGDPSDTAKVELIEPESDTMSDPKPEPVEEQTTEPLLDKEEIAEIMQEKPRTATLKTPQERERRSRKATEEPMHQKPWSDDFKSPIDDSVRTEHNTEESATKDKEDEQEHLPKRSKTPAARLKKQKTAVEFKLPLTPSSDRIPTAEPPKISIPPCQGCTLAFTPSDTILEALGYNWHLSCFRCAGESCHKELGENCTVVDARAVEIRVRANM